MQEPTLAMTAPPIFVAVHRRDVELLERRLWHECKAPPERFIRWQPHGRTGTPMVVLAPDLGGRVWLVLVATTDPWTLHFIRIDSATEISQVIAAYPHAGDRPLIAGWFADGLEEEIRKLFAS